MLDVTLTFAEEELGLSHADLSLCWRDLHLDGGWVKRKKMETEYTLVSGCNEKNVDTRAKHNKGRLKIKLLRLLKRTNIFPAYPL